MPLELDATPGHPLRFDFDAEYPAQSNAPEDRPAPHSDTQLAIGGESYAGMGGITNKLTGASHVTGKVLLSDGTTPVLGAQVFYYPAGSK